jgi:hypothetical protein
MNGRTGVLRMRGWLGFRPGKVGVHQARSSIEASERHKGGGQ